MFSFDRSQEPAAPRQMGQPVWSQPQRQLTDQLVPYTGALHLSDPEECQFADTWVGEMQAQG